MSQQLVANCRIDALNLESDALRCDRLNQIGASDNSDQLSIAHDRYPLDRILLHQGSDLIKGSIGPGSDDLAHHQVPDFVGMRLDVFGGECLSPAQQQAIPRALMFGARLRSPQQVAFAYDSDQLLLIVDDGDCADMVLEQGLSELSHRGVRLDGNHGGNHYVAGFHRSTPRANATTHAGKAGLISQGIGSAL